MPRKKRSRDAFEATSETYQRAQAALEAFAAIQGAMEKLRDATQAALDDARRKHAPAEKRRRAAIAHEHGMFLDLLVASVHPTLRVGSAVSLPETIKEAWHKRWAALRLAACLAWFEEHKALGFPTGSAITDERLDRLAVTLASDVPPLLGWEPPAATHERLRALVEAAVGDAHKQGVRTIAATLLGRHIGADAKTILRERADTKAKLRIPRQLP